jgi:hypothetical protein
MPLEQGNGRRDKSGFWRLKRRQHWQNATARIARLDSGTARLHSSRE